jgi:hypothetical protein
VRLWAAAIPVAALAQCAPECAPVSEGPAAVVEWTAGDCDSFAEEAAAAGLPWGTFSRIAWRESGCNPNVWVVDSDDNGGGLFGFNFIGSMINYWDNLCGMSKSEVRGNVPLQMECAAAQYNQYGLSAWR